MNPERFHVGAWLVINAVVIFPALVVLAMWSGRKFLNWLACKLQRRAMRVRNAQLNELRRTPDFRVGGALK